MHNSLSVALSEGIIEFVAVVQSQVVTSERLTAVLVDTLENLLSKNQPTAQPNQGLNIPESPTL